MDAGSKWEVRKRRRKKWKSARVKELEFKKGEV